MVAILIMSGKLATLGLLDIKAFLNKGYDVIVMMICGWTPLTSYIFFEMSF